MSVLCCHIPDFSIALACRQYPAWRDQPLALLGPDERVWAVSPTAQRYGVQVEMRPPQAQIACPDVLLRPLDVAAAQAEQSALLAELAVWALPVEPQAWGQAYVDLHAVAKTAAVVQPLAAELGRRLRHALGDALLPALGWDSGKFTARVAAVNATPGRMRLVDKADEVRFLQPLPITLLPLPRPHLQQLHWLGIRTLGQFAKLPATAVWQRFGAGGKLAQRLAQGRDDRPVRAGVSSAAAPITIPIDPPTGLLQPVVDATMASLRPLLAERAAGLEGVRRLRIELSFVTGGTRAVDLTFVEPASQAARVQTALVQHLCALRWPGEVQAVQWTLLETGELAAPQLSLFAESLARLAPIAAIAEQFSSRYGPLFFQANLPNPTHPAPERRGALNSIVPTGHAGGVV